jgi:hypothetical protein
MNSRFGHVTYTKLGIRHATLIHFCRDFDIKIQLEVESPSERVVDKDSYLSPNFVYFLMENKTFIRMYDLDYYSNKTVEIISNKIGRKEQEIEEYFQSQKYKIDTKYPYRYLSSYKIDYELGEIYEFLRYNPSDLYEGNFEFRRRNEEI